MVVLYYGNGFVCISVDGGKEGAKFLNPVTIGEKPRRYSDLGIAMYRTGKGLIDNSGEDWHDETRSPVKRQ